MSMADAGIWGGIMLRACSDGGAVTWLDRANCPFFSDKATKVSMVPYHDGFAQFELPYPSNVSLPEATNFRAKGTFKPQ